MELALKQNKNIRCLEMDCFLNRTDNIGVECKLSFDIA